MMATNCLDFAGGTVDYEFEVNLIQAVKQQHCLYVKDHPQYGHKIYNDIAWLRICKSLKRSTLDCTNKWYCLLQTFLNFSRLEDKGDKNVFRWPHYKALKEMQPQMITRYIELFTSKYDGEINPKITDAQQEGLLQELELHRTELMSIDTTNTRRQQIWSDIASKLNADKNGVPLPTIRWQKAWWDLKQRVGIWKRLELKGIKVNKVKNNLSEDMRVSKICGLSPTEEDRYKEKLESYIEFEIDRDGLVCKQCFASQYGSSLKDLCEKCSKTDVTICDICLRNPSSSACDITNWSSAAKRMIPFVCRKKTKLSMCKICRTTLETKASVSWKMCRFCAKESEQLKNFLSTNFQKIRDTFYSATKIKVCIADGLPCFICLRCCEELLNFNSFYVNFSSAQTVLQKIHEQNFIGEVLKIVPSKVKGEKRSNERCLPSQETVEENKRIGLSSEVFTVYEKGLIQNASQTSNLNNSKASHDCTATHIAYNPAKEHAETLKIPSASQVGVSVPSPVFIPVQLGNSLKSLPSNQAPSAMWKVSNLDEVRISPINLGQDSNSIRRACHSPEIVINKVVKKEQTRVGDKFFNLNQSRELQDTSIVFASSETNIKKEESSNCALTQTVISKDLNLNQASIGSPLPKIQKIGLSNASDSLEMITAAKKVFSLNEISVTVSLSPQTVLGPNGVQQIPHKSSTVQEVPKPTTIKNPSVLFSKSTANPMLQGLLDRPAIEVTSSPVAHFHSQQRLTSSSYQAGLSSPSVGTPVEIKSSTKCTQQALKDFATKKPPKKAPPRRKTIHHLPAAIRTENPRKASLESEVIVIRDDTPPREVQSSHTSNAMQVDLGLVINNLNPLMFCAGTVDLTEPLTESNEFTMECDETFKEQKEEEYIEFISPSFLIDYAVNRAYKIYSPTRQTEDDRHGKEKSKLVKDDGEKCTIPEKIIEHNKSSSNQAQKKTKKRSLRVRLKRSTLKLEDMKPKNPERLNLRPRKLKEMTQATYVADNKSKCTQGQGKAKKR